MYKQWEMKAPLKIDKKAMSAGGLLLKVEVLYFLALPVLGLLGACQEGLAVNTSLRLALLGLVPLLVYDFLYIGCLIHFSRDRKGLVIPVVPILLILLAQLRGDGSDFRSFFLEETLIEAIALLMGAMFAAVLCRGWWKDPPDRFAVIVIALAVTPFAWFFFVSWWQGQPGVQSDHWWGLGLLLVALIYNTYFYAGFLKRVIGKEINLPDLIRSQGRWGGVLIFVQVIAWIVVSLSAAGS